MVKIEAVKKSKCKGCQSFGHTINFYGKPPRCVKCTGCHSTKDCDKPANTKPKCVNCGENNPANYRGCIIAKELQKLRKRKRTLKLYVQFLATL